MLSKTPPRPPLKGGSFNKHRHQHRKEASVLHKNLPPQRINGIAKISSPPNISYFKHLLELSSRDPLNSPLSARGFSHHKIPSPLPFKSPVPLYTSPPYPSAFLAALRNSPPFTPTSKPPSPPAQAHASTFPARPAQARLRRSAK